jgi:hypothetical protein
MSSQDRDRRRGGPAGRRRRDWQGWNGPGWSGPGWNGPGSNGDDWNGDRRQRNWGGDWHARGWSGDWRAAAWSDDDPTANIPQDSPWDGQRQDARGVGQSGRRAGGGGVPAKRVRIGDSERDQAVSLLSDHFVAGRLTQAEFEERSEQATRARYSDELEPLFDELPRSRELQPLQGGPGNLRRRPGPPPAFLMIAPFLMIALVISSVALAAPWLLWGMFWLVMISGITRRRWHHH